MAENKPLIRLQKYIADCGVCSRRKAEEFMIQGRVKVNGIVESTLGTKVNPNSDTVEVDGHLIDSKQVEKVYIVLNKPRGYLTTVNDPEGRRTVMDLIKDCSERVFPVGRLDYLSEGLLILTNDGELANMVLHPKYNVTKVYEVKVFGAVDSKILSELQQGRQLEDGYVKPQTVRVIKQLNNKTWLEFRLNEGRNREIRKICEAVGLTVDKLKRVAIEGLTVDGIRPGGYRYVHKKALMGVLNLNSDGTKNTEGKQYSFRSRKRTIDLRQRGPQMTTAADDDAFKIYRRDVYFQTIKDIDAAKKLRRENEYKARQEEYLKSQEERMKKLEAKKERKAKKASIKFL